MALRLRLCAGGGYVASNGRGAALRTCTAGGRATTAGCCVKGAISANDAVLSGASNRRSVGLRSFPSGLHCCLGVSIQHSPR